MSNTYADDPARGLSKLQKAILVWLAEWRDWFIELELDAEPVLIPWRARCSFYGGVHPMTRVFGFGVNYTPKERAAVSRTIRRLWKRGLVNLYGQRQITHIALTEPGIQTANALREGGGTRTYQDLWPHGLDEIRAVFYRMVGAAMEDLPAYINSQVDRDPVRALRGLLTVLSRS